ncbi:hypothetical protein AB6A40_011489 [Gnathostoma spinigerum]|uniref:Uncharacterized protein n=1 Tax=Gnathostoma spinigerum TaxID=75299 RepID=A0ABD6F4Q3_9BILA
MGQMKELGTVRERQKTEKPRDLKEMEEPDELEGLEGLKEECGLAKEKGKQDMKLEVIEKMWESGLGGNGAGSGMDEEYE